MTRIPEVFSALLSALPTMGCAPPADRTMFPGKSHEKYSIKVSPCMWLEGWGRVAVLSFLLTSAGPGSYNMPHMLFVQSYITALHHLG